MNPFLGKFLFTVAFLFLALDFGSVRAQATGAPMAVAPQVRNASAANDALFREVVFSPNGVGMTDEALYPSAVNRQIVKIEVLAAYNGANIGIEHWTVAHTETDSVIYLVRLVSDGKGGTTIAVGRDVAAEAELAKPTPLPPVHTANTRSLRFENVDYVHHWTQQGSELFSPATQTNLETYSDLIIIGFFPAVREADALADLANTLVAKAKESAAIVVTARTIPGTALKTGECFFVTVTPDGKSMRVQFSRLMIVDGQACMVAYDHRIFGSGSPQAMKVWLSDNGGRIEQDLLEWDAGQPLTSFRG